ncbi:class II aldolase/adducin family protein [Oricola sp.]|uniref:class II aldolase/adducin family protein n=1 Tax=Oricola sp. TaxID=1979950 RepID=UPI003BA9BDCC
MENLWRDDEIDPLRNKAGGEAADVALAERVYSSRLLGREPDLVLHGGGNTSVKVDRTWPDGSKRRTLHVKGSGWDLATIEAPGLPAVDLEPLLAARTSGGMSDPEMVALLRANLMDRDAPNPSVETLLHAFIPHAFVDHTHSLPILVLANQPDAEQLCAEVFGDEVAFVPYVMPGFDLSIACGDIYDRNPGCKGLFLQNHGLFTFSDDARESYSLTIEYTSEAEDYLAGKGAALAADLANEANEPEALTARLGEAFAAAFPEMASVAFDYREDANVRSYTGHDRLDEISRRGTVTPDHVIRIKPFAMICSEDDPIDALAAKMRVFAAEYTAYFDRHAPNAAEPKTMLGPQPKAIVVRGRGIYGVDSSEKGAGIVADLMVQTTRAVIASEALGSFRPISEPDLFEMEYWTLEQAKSQRK